jgi:hypothetical protein
MFSIGQLKHIAVALAISAAVASAAQAATRPDDRAGPLGIGAQSVAADTSDVVSRYLVNHPAGVRPDDRAGPLGIGTQPVAADTSDVVSRYLGNHPAAVRPDDRAGIRGVGSSVELIPLSGGSSFAWGDASIGAAIGFGLALALLGVALMTTRRPMGGHRTGTAAAG